MSDQPDLFENNDGKTPGSHGSIDSLVQRSSSGIQPCKPINDTYNIRWADLRNLFFPELRTVFYGINNMNIPKEMLEVMNPAEILALYAGLFKLKEERSKGRELAVESAYDLIRQAHKEGYKLNMIRVLQIKGKNRHSIESGSLKKRIETLDSGVQEKFIESFKVRRRYSDKDFKYEDRGLLTLDKAVSSPDFYDPSIDAKDKNVYIRQILDVLKK